MQGGSSMISYSIEHHFPGRIRIEVPLLKRFAVAELKKLATVPVPSGIKSVRVNPITGSLIISYDPDRIDIVAYITQMGSSKDLTNYLYS
jgi:hypothetical protein